jgi:hypothetical protein
MTGEERKAEQKAERKAEGMAIASAVVESLRNQPVILAVVVLQLVVTGLLYKGVTEARKRDQVLNRFILERCLPTAPTAPS